MNRISPTAQVSARETERSAALHRYQALDTPREEEFDDIVRIAAEVCGAPVAIISLVDTRRIFLKAEIGLGVRDLPLETSFSGHAILEADFMIVPDATRDPRFAGNPLVAGEPRMRFYAGAPMRTPDGFVIGAVCVLDREPRALHENQVRALKLLARHAMIQLELRRKSLEQAIAVSRSRALLTLGERLRNARDIGAMGRIAGEIVGEALGVTRAGYGRLDLNSDCIDIDPDWRVEGEVSVAGRHRLDDYGEFSELIRRGQNVVIADVRSEALTAENPSALLHLGVRSLVNMTLEDAGQAIAVFFAHDREPRTWAADDLDFLRAVADRTQAQVARLRMEANQRVLNEELIHRLKNTLAVVQSIAKQTLRSADHKSVEAFIQRIQTLSSAHDIMFRGNWTSAAMRDIITSTLATFGEKDKFDLSGPAVRIGPRAAFSLSLLAHELATNAIKHGSLSRPGGRVELSWRVEPENGEDILRLSWRETGGPPVRTPRRMGFGSRLIRMGLAGAGGVELSYEPSGFASTMRAPLAQLRQR